MSLIDKLEDLVIKVDTEYQQKMEAVIRGDSSGDAGRERAPCRRVYVYGQDGEHDGYRYLYIKGRG